MDELISIVVPVYNVEQYLDRCIESLVSQTYQNIEILLVDDGATDNSGGICDKWGEEDNRIRVFHKNNGGLSDARNYGIKHALGKYLSFVDSDDYVDKNFIGTLYKIISTARTQMAVVGYQCFEDEKQLRFECFKTEGVEINILEKKDAIEDLFVGSYGDFSWNKLYDRNLFNSVQFPLGRKMEDLGTTYKIMMQCDRIAYSPMKLYFYYQRQGSILHTAGLNLLTDKYALISERYIFLKAYYPDMIENYICYFYTALETFPFVSQDEQIEIHKEINQIWKQFKPRINNKARIKYVLMRYLPKLYSKIRYKKEGL